MQLSLVAIASVLGLAVAAPANSGFVHIPLSRTRKDDSNSLNNPSKATGEVTAELVNGLLAYQAQIIVGSDNQQINTVLDTGSPFLWVWSRESPFCTSMQGLFSCALGGAYLPSTSTTSHNTGAEFNITYGLGSASGNFYTDDVSLGGATLKKFPFGVNAGQFANNSNAIFGIGPTGGKYGNLSYSHLLVEQGIVKRGAYGLSLPGLNNYTAEITFGAINTGRFEGKLKTVPIVDDKWHFQVPASASANGETFLDNGKVVLDSGTSLTYLNNKTWPGFRDVVKKSGIELKPFNDMYTFNCTEGDKVEWEFDFDGQKIKNNLTAASIDIRFVDASTTHPPDTCVLGFLPGPPELEPLNLLGDTFLRSAYSVYDLEKNTVSIAQAVWGQPDEYTVITGDIPDSN